MLASSVLAAALDRVPFFTDRLVPAPTQLRLLTDAERALAVLAQANNAHYLEQRATIYLIPSADHAVGTAGLGTTGGFGVSESAVLELDGATGKAQSLDLSNPLDTYRAVASATINTVTVAGTPWTTDQWANKMAAILAGPGVGRALIAGNDSNTLLLDSDLPAVPTTASLLGIFDPTPSVDSQDALVTSLSLVRQDVGYLTKLDATGAAYIDLTSPLTASYQQRVPLPVLGAVLGVQGWGPNDTRPTPITFLPADSRDRNFYGPAVVYTAGGLTLVGDAQAWSGYSSLDVFYQPIPPEITATSQTMLMPEPAKEALASGLALMFARRLVRADPNMDSDGSLLLDMRDDATTAQAVFLTQVKGTGVARATSIVEAF